VKVILIIIGNKSIDFVLPTLSQGKTLRETGTSIVKIFSGLKSNKLDKIN